jgi:hypothetical protein
LLYSLLHSPVTSLLSGPTVFFSTPPSNALSLCSSFSVTDQHSQPYKTTGYFLLHKITKQLRYQQMLTNAEADKTNGKHTHTHTATYTGTWRLFLSRDPPHTSNKNLWTSHIKQKKTNSPSQYSHVQIKVFFTISRYVNFCISCSLMLQLE